MKLERPQPVRSAFALLTQLPGGVLVIEDGRVVEASAIAEELLGGRLQGLPVERLFSPRLLADLGREPRVHVESLMRLDGSETLVEVRLGRVNCVDRTLVVAMLRDIAREQAARRDLEAARDAALQATEQKTQFLTLASHDLRQPVQALQFLLDGMRARATGELPSLIERAQRSLDHMTELLNRLLELARLESGQMQPRSEEISLDALLLAVRNEFLPAAQGKGLELEVRLGGEWLRSDPGLLREIVSNLVSNAIQYTSKGGVVLATQRGPGESCDLTVLDSGCGIPPDRLDDIFEDFRRLAGAGGVRSEGFGLGLGIVKRLAEALGLQILVSSRPGVGSCFTLRIPAERRLACRAEPATPVAGTVAGRTHEPGAGRFALHGRSILVVDDDPAVREATRLWFELHGARVLSAASAAEAIVLADAERAALSIVVCDFALGVGPSGSQLLHELRRRCGPLPAIIVTGDAAGPQVFGAADGLTRIVCKPVAPEHLLALGVELLSAGTLQ